MANLRRIRERIASIQNTQQITRAMKMVAAAKLRKAQNQIVATRPYAQKLESVVTNLVHNIDYHSRFLNPVENPQKILFIIVGSDRGLCGGFNNNLFKVLETKITSDFSEHKKAGNLDFICIGKKATDYFNKRKFNVVAKHPGFFENLRFEHAHDIMRDVIRDFELGTYDSVFVAYNEFKSVIAQNREIEQLLPLKSIAASDGGESEQTFSTDYLFEPSPQQIIEKLIPLHLNTQLWKSVLESNASEQGARMAAMDNATENAKELMRNLRLEYNQARQAAITTELTEIVSGAQALSE